MQLLLRAGMVAQSSSGLYHILPLGHRVLRKIKLLVREYMDAVGAQECALATLTPKELWQASGRWDGIGAELMRVVDRKSAEFCLAPTHEEAVTALVGGHNLSYRALPQLLYQMERKFRDEMRPRYGLIRAREFWMKDLYTFDRDEVAAQQTYERVTAAYASLLTELQLPFSRVQADPSAMGGVSSHEFHVHASIGEDDIVYCDTCERAANAEALATMYGECPHREAPAATPVPVPAPATTAATTAAASAAAAAAAPADVPTLTTPLAASKPLPPSSQCRLHWNKGIEVGHAFLLGEKYSHIFDASYTDDKGARRPAFMGCYGLGLTRLIATMAEVLHDEDGLRWPLIVAPYSVGIVTVGDNRLVDEAAEVLAQRLDTLGLHDDVIIDRR
jgi:prolyl-tRNA synthetase